MNTNKITFVIAAVLSVIWAAGTVSYGSGESKLRMSLVLDKTSYFIDEPVWLDMYVTNEGDSQTRVHPPTTYGDWLKIVVIDEHGDTLTDWGPKGFFTGPMSLKVEPGDTLFGMTNLLEDFGESAKSINHLRALPPGKYTVKAIHSHPLVSNEVSFTVVEPTSEEGVAHDLYISGLIHRSVNVDRSISELKKLLTQYPSSVFAPSACSTTWLIYSFYNPDELLAMGYAARTVMDYPNSGHAIRLQGFLVKKFGHERAVAILDSLISASGSTRLRMGTKNTRKREQ